MFSSAFDRVQATTIALYFDGGIPASNQQQQQPKRQQSYRPTLICAHPPSSFFPPFIYYMLLVLLLWITFIYFPDTHSYRIHNAFSTTITDNIVTLPIHLITIVRLPLFSSIPNSFWCLFNLNTRECIFLSRDYWIFSFKKKGNLSCNYWCDVERMRCDWIDFPHGTERTGKKFGMKMN